MSRKRKHILWTTLVVGGLVSIAAGAVSRWPSTVKEVRAESTSAAITGLPSTAPRKKEILGYAVVTLTRAGFEPAEITHDGRRFFLMIDNQSGLSDLTIRIDPEHGNRIREVSQPTDQRKWVDEMDLPPGKYHISTPNRPGWVCQLTVKP